jgi:dihydroorotate dehydrogenase (NAD+) catalytic subunit
MHSELKLAELLLTMKGRVGSIPRLASKIGVTEKSLRDWLRKTEDSLHRLHQGNIEQIIKAARDLGIEPELFAPAPQLWNTRASFEENLLLDPGMPVSLGAPLRNHSVPFLGYTVNSRFGASASVLTSTPQRIRFLANSGSDVLTYKTVRSDIFRSHLPPNIFFCADSTPVLDPEDRNVPRVVVGDNPEVYRAAYGAMNRFGMPSPSPEVWQADYQAAKGFLREGQILILSVVGTAKLDDPEEVLVKDTVKVVGQGIEAGAEVIEVNCSCPNCNGMEGELFRNVGLVERICKAIRNIAGDTKIILKIGFLKERELREFVVRTAPYVNGYSAINTVPVEGMREGQGGLEPAFGKPKLRAGLSGPPIHRYGLSCVRNLARIRAQEKLTGIGIIGIGGATTPAIVQNYIDCGADIVQATTAFFVDSYFGIKVRRFMDSQLNSFEVSSEEEREIARVNWSKAIAALEFEFGHEASISRRIREAAVAEILDWESAHKSTAALGPRRSMPILSVDEFKGRIRARLARG